LFENNLSDLCEERETVSVRIKRNRLEVRGTCKDVTGKRDADQSLRNGRKRGGPVKLGIILRQGEFLAKKKKLGGGGNKWEKGGKGREYQPNCHTGKTRR